MSGDLAKRTRSEVDLPAAMDRAEIVAAIGQIAHAEARTNEARLKVGVALHTQRMVIPHGQWTAYIAGIVDETGAAARTLNDWMTAAGKAFELPAYPERTPAEHDHDRHHQPRICPPAQPAGPGND